MFCFARFCCMCLAGGKNKNLVSMDYICKDNMCLIDKMSVCLHEEFQDIIKYKIENPEICSSCRDQLNRAYRFIQNTKRNLYILKGYADTLSDNNYKKSASKLQISLNTPPKNKKRKKVPDNIESNDKADDTCEICIPLPNIIEDSRKNIIDNTESNYELCLPLPAITEDYFKFTEFIDVKPVIDINNLLKVHKIKEEPDDIEEYSDISAKTELLNDADEYEYNELFELSIKDEFFMPECSRSSPIDFKLVVNSTIENDEDTLPISEPVETEEISKEISNAVETEVQEANRTQELEKRKKPPPLPCPLCKSTFYSANAMARHLSKQHNKSRFNCTVCSLSFKSEIVLKRHILIHSKELYS